jgi:hypothetical protein
MRVELNDKVIILPSSLSELTLGQRIAFHNQYGRELDEMLQSILAMDDTMERDLEFVHFQYEKMFRTFAFFANTTPEALKESAFIDDIARIYHASLSLLFEDEQQLEPQQEFSWKGELWELQPPQLSNGSRIKFGEFIDSKQLIKDMMDLGKGKWEYMRPLAAIYLRKKGEAYQEEFLFEDSERLRMMNDLPMDMALQVGFFLTTSMNTYLNTLLSSKSPELKTQVNSVPSTLPGGDGSIS